MPNKTIKQSFSVPYEYKLYFTENLFDAQNSLFKDIFMDYRAHEKVRLLFVIDSGVHEHHPSLSMDIQRYCNSFSEHILHTKSIIVSGGEKTKNDDHNVSVILDGINEHGICRHSFVIVIGGGAVIDMAGYAAAIAHRGVKLIRIPTTVLSQNDSAVGVKNGINAFGKKNFIGTFSPPYAIINDTNFLNTLEQRDWIAGISEAVKVSLIKDRQFFEYIAVNSHKLRDRDMEAMNYTIYRCAEMHMQHISQGGDPFESGSSRPLDFGHWAAHKLEQMTNYELRHGEAVAKGIALDVTYAHLIGLITNETLLRIIGVLEELGLNLAIPIKNKKEQLELIKGIEEFREHLGGELTITLISGIGKKHDVHEIDVQLMQEAITLLNNTSNKKVA